MKCPKTCSHPDQGSQQPLGLYTYDVSLEEIAMPESDSTPATPGGGSLRGIDSRRGSAKSQVVSEIWTVAGQYASC